MNLDDLAAASGEPESRLREWEALGLFEAEPDGSYSTTALERVRLIAYAWRRGVAPEAIAAASTEQGDVLAHYLDMAGIAGGRIGRAIADAGAEVGLDPDFVRRLALGAGLADQGEIYEEDMEMLHTAATAIGAGMPAEAFLQLVRVYNDSLTRVAEAENRLFHFYVHERLKAEGLQGGELATATQDISKPLRDLIEPAVLYFHRKAFSRSLRDDMVVHMAEAVARPGEAVGQVTVTVLFVDLADFTVMTEVMGDSTAAAVVERFSDLVREAAATCEGRVLKQIGDEFMLVFREADLALRFGIGIMDAVGVEPQFPDVRIGANAGTALYREGDYLGATVNVAARVTSYAGRGQFLVTAPVRMASDIGGVEYTSIGDRILRNVAEPVELFEVRHPQRISRPVDPVCGMSIDPATCTFRVQRTDGTVMFCSEACRRRFVEAPGAYATRR